MLRFKKQAWPEQHDGRKYVPTVEASKMLDETLEQIELTFNVRGTTSAQTMCCARRKPGGLSSVPAVGLVLAGWPQCDAFVNSGPAAAGSCLPDVN